jgi:hypothetical protein
MGDQWLKSTYEDLRRASLRDPGSQVVNFLRALWTLTRGSYEQQPTVTPDWFQPMTGADHISGRDLEFAGMRFRVVLIRGTATPNDWLVSNTHLTVMRHILPGRIPRRLLQSLQAVVSAVQHTDVPVLVVGHSLGAAEAGAVVAALGNHHRLWAFGFDNPGNRGIAAQLRQLRLMQYELPDSVRERIFSLQFSPNVINVFGPMLAGDIVGSVMRVNESEPVWRFLLFSARSMFRIQPLGALMCSDNCQNHKPPLHDHSFTNIVEPQNALPFTTYFQVALGFVVVVFGARGLPGGLFWIALLIALFLLVILNSVETVRVTERDFEDLP